MKHNRKKFHSNSFHLAKLQSKVHSMCQNNYQAQNSFFVDRIMDIMSGGFDVDFLAKGSLMYLLYNLLRRGL